MRVDDDDAFDGDLAHVLTSRRALTVAERSSSIATPACPSCGLVFIGGTFDPFIRAFDIAIGRELWKGALPFAGHATPITYQLAPHGKQFVVIAAGGHAKIAEEPVGDALVAFALR